MKTMERSGGAERFAFSRADALALEYLIDVDEWCEAHAIPPIFPFPAAMTRQLCDAIESIPYAMLGSTDAAQRSRGVFERGARALQRCLGAEACEPAAELEATFAAPLPERAGDRAWRLLKLHCGLSDDAKPVITLGLDDEELG